MTRHRLLFAVSLLLFAGCDVADVRDLGTFQTADPQTQAEAVITCDIADAVCAKEARVKARACLQLTQERVENAQASSSEARMNAACALDTFDDIIAVASPSTGADFVGRMEALRLSREIATSDSQARSTNQSLARAAESYASSVPDEAAGPYYAADSAFWSGSDSSGAASCDNYAAAEDWLERAGQGRATKDFESFNGPVSALKEQVNRDAALKGCAA